MKSSKSTTDRRAFTLLNQEQRAAYEKGKSLYVHYLMADSPSTDDLDALYDAFEILAPHVDAVDDIDLRLIFALTVHSMQQSGEFTLSKYCIDTKGAILLETLKWFINLTEDSAASLTNIFKMILCFAFDQLAVILLKGEELPQNDHVAFLCYYHSKQLGYSGASDNILDCFEKDESGKMVLRAGLRRPD